jgi:mannonate dehydratase
MSTESRPASKKDSSSNATPRRDFLKLPLAAGAAGALLYAGASQRGDGDDADETKSDSKPKRVIGEHHPKNIKLAHRISLKISDEELLFLKQIGMRWVRVNFPTTEGTYEHIAKAQERFAKFDLRIFSGVHYAYRDVKVQLGLRGRDELIRTYQQFLCDLGKLDIPVSCYDFHPANTYTTGHVKRRGYTAREFDIEVFRKKVEKQRFDREYSAADIWKNYTHFMKAVLPVAEEAGVKLALHPDDPPVAKMNGVAKLFTHYDGYKRAEEIAGDSKFWGLTFCVGTWSEGGEQMGKNVFQMIEDFGRRGKIFTVHFRNVTGPLPKFVETFLDDGYMDMYQVMKSLRKVGFAGSLVPDHIPQLAGDTGIRRAGLAYCISYMRGLLRRANEDVG